MTPDQARLEAVRQWAATGIMRQPWPLGDGTAVMLRLCREVLRLLGDDTPAAQVIGALSYIRERYGPLTAGGDG